MEHSIRNRTLHRYFEVADASELSAPNVSRIGRILRVLDATTRPDDICLPGDYFHALRRRMVDPR